MIRKVIKQANQAFTITLPIEWVRDNNIEKHNEVELEIQDKSLVIKNTHGVSVKKSKVTIDYIDRGLIGRRIQALYASGIDEIGIDSKEDIGSSLIDVASELVGYALVSQDKNHYVIKDIGGGNYSDLDEIFKRVFQMVLMFYESAISDIFGKESETQDDLDNRDSEINKFCLFLERAINKLSYSDPIKGRILFTYSFALEKIGDEIHRLWRSNINNKIKKSQKLKELMLLSKEGLDLIFDFYYNSDLKTIDAIHKIKQKVRKNALEFIKTGENELARHAIKIIEDSADLGHLSLMNKNDQ
jgi:phosphate uptake regulator